LIRRIFTRATPLTTIAPNFHLTSVDTSAQFNDDLVSHLTKVNELSGLDLGSSPQLYAEFFKFFVSSSFDLLHLCGEIADARSATLHTCSPIGPECLLRRRVGALFRPLRLRVLLLRAADEHGGGGHEDRGCGDETRHADRLDEFAAEPRKLSTGPTFRRLICGGERRTGRIPEDPTRSR
jgi:hypothetical protein